VKQSPDVRQLDLFVAYLTDLPLRDQRDVMERPFFSLSKGRRTKPIEYQVGGVGVKVSAPADIGLATIYDADVLIWAASQINEAREKGLQHSPRLAFQPYDLLKAIKRTTSGADYKRLRNALRRLTATTVETNIRAPSGSKWAVFHWLERVEEEVDDKGRCLGMVIDGSIASSENTPATRPRAGPSLCVSFMTRADQRSGFQTSPAICAKLPRPTICPSITSNSTRANAATSVCTPSGAPCCTPAIQPAPRISYKMPGSGAPGRGDSDETVDDDADRADGCISISAGG